MANVSAECGHDAVRDIANNEALADRARALGLEYHIRHHPGQGRITSQKSLATALEAVIGAVYIDCGESIPVTCSAVSTMDMAFATT